MRVIYLRASISAALLAALLLAAVSGAGRLGAPHETRAQYDAAAANPGALQPAQRSSR